MDNKYKIPDYYLIVFIERWICRYESSDFVGGKRKKNAELIMW